MREKHNIPETQQHGTNGGLQIVGGHRGPGNFESIRVGIT